MKIKIARVDGIHDVDATLFIFRRHRFAVHAGVGTLAYMFVVSDFKTGRVIASAETKRGAKKNAIERLRQAWKEYIAIISGVPRLNTMPRRAAR